MLTSNNYSPFLHFHFLVSHLCLLERSFYVISRARRYVYTLVSCIIVGDVPFAAPSTSVFIIFESCLGFFCVAL